MKTIKNFKEELVNGLIIGLAIGLVVVSGLIIGIIGLAIGLGEDILIFISLLTMLIVALICKEVVFP